MKLLDILRKLGIVRYGAKAGTYTSAKDRPAEFMMDDVYDAKKDLTTKEDVAHLAEALKKSGGRKVFFWVTVALGVLAVLLLAAAGGLSLWLFFTLGLWGGILYFAYRFAFEGLYSYAGLIALVLFSVLASFVLLGVSVPK
ncbi:MAG: hypothetical protein ACUVXF_01490 [Desulfobaccales bacterium]